MADEMQGAADELRRLERLVDLFAASAVARQAGAEQNTTQTTNIGDRAAGLLVYATAALLGLSVGLGIIVISHDRKIDDLRHHLTAIYMLAPHLKPEEK